jgi:cell fate (sporulation/competence/biofilm development) regulator YlbF (YheA/YmcA/DUF963 family)
MDVQTKPFDQPTAVNLNPQEAAKRLGNYLRHTTEYETFSSAYKAVNNDPTVQKLGNELRAHQRAMQWSFDAENQHATEIARLEQEIEALPVVHRFVRQRRKYASYFMLWTR